MNRFKCPKCFHLDFWKTGDNRLKCKNCRHIFTPKPNPFNIPNPILEELVSEFLLEHSTNIILERIEISKYKLLKLLIFFRELMSREASFSGKNQNPTQSKIKYPILGIFVNEGGIFAEILPNIEEKDLKSLKEGFSKNRGRKYLPEIWKKYDGIVLNDSFHRLEDNSKKHRFDVLEGFWGYLKRKLSAKGGIRKERLPLYLGEYSWRFNHRKLSFKEQKEYLLKLFFEHFN